VPIDRLAAETFIWSAARLVDRHRYAMLFLGGRPDPVAAALCGYQNEDGGFGHALEPDLRSPESQPAPTLAALEMLHEAGLPDSEMATAARAWIASIAAPNGSVPQALPGFERYPHAPWWSSAPGSMLTFGLAGVFHAAALTGDDWLERATQWCWSAIETMTKPAGYWLKFACTFLDAVADDGRARAALHRLRSQIDPTTFAVAGGAEGERLRPLDISPRPGSRSRELFAEAEIEAHLDDVERGQQQDGGWRFDWLAWSPAQTAAWRGTVTIRALSWLRENGRRI
jgi:hypothetical protein